MRKLFLLLFYIIISLLFMSSCGKEKENQEINLGEKFIKELYNVDEPSVDINDSSPEDLIEFQNKFSSYFTEDEFTNLASIRFFLLPQEVSNKQNSKISVENISFTKRTDHQNESTTNFDFTFTLISTNHNQYIIDKFEVKGQMSIIESNNELKINRYYDHEPLKDVLYRNEDTTN